MLTNPSSRTSASPLPFSTTAIPFVATALSLVLAAAILLLGPGAGQAAAQAACSGSEVSATSAETSGPVDLSTVAGRRAIGVAPDAPNQYVFNEDRAARFCVDIERSGIYLISADTIAPSRQADSFWVSTAAGEIALWDVPASTGWTSSIVTERSDKEAVQLRLDAGRNEITFYARESGTYISKFALLRSANLERLGTPVCAGLEQEAENGAVGGQILTAARLITNAENTASGGGYVAAPPWLANEHDLVRSHVAQYCVTSSRAGEFKLAVRALAPGARSDSFWVQVNANAPILWDVPHSESWIDHVVRDGRADEDVTFALREGANTLRVYQRDSGTLLDKFAFVPSGETIRPIEVAPVLTPSPATPVPTATRVPATPTPTEQAIRPAYLSSDKCVTAIAGRPMSVSLAEAFVQRSTHALVYSLSGPPNALPPGAAIDSSSGLFTSAQLPSTPADFAFTVTASNQGGSAVAAICVESAGVTPAPIFTGIPVSCYVARAAQPLNLDVGHMFDDAQDDSLRFLLDDDAGDDLALRNFSIDAASGEVRVNRLTNRTTRIALPIEVTDGRNVAQVTLCLAVATDAPVHVGALDCIKLSTRGAPVNFSIDGLFLDLVSDDIAFDLIAGPGQTGLSNNDDVRIAAGNRDYFTDLDVIVRASDGRNLAIWTLCVHITLIGDAIPSDDLDPTG